MGEVIEIAAASEPEFIPGIGYVDENGVLVSSVGDMPAPIAEKLKGRSVFEALRAGEDVEFTESEVEWVVSKLFAYDSTISSSKDRLAREIEAIRANYEPVVREAERGKARFWGLFEPVVRRFAEGEVIRRATKADGTLKATYTKSVRFPKGVLKFRAESAKPASLAVAADRKTAEALEWAQANAPHLVVLKPALDLSLATEDDIALVRATLDAPLAVIEAREAGEAFKVDTGVK